MKNVVITGSSRGIGYGLAEEFLSSGCSVFLNGRNKRLISQAVEVLGKKYGSQYVDGFVCDMTDYSQVHRLWEHAVKRFDHVDIWINNAGTSHPRLSLWKDNPGDLKRAIDTNLTGTVFGSHVAISGMMKQEFGALYNMEGLGSDNRKCRGLAVYGATKSAVRYFTESLAIELEEEPIIIGTVNPGIVLTDLFTLHFGKEASKLEESRKISEILAEEVESVTPWLVEKILSNSENGARITRLTPSRVLKNIIKTHLKQIRSKE